MRKVTTLSEGDGKVLARYLQAQQIEVVLRAETSSTDFELWVVDEEDCERVREILTAFRQDPFDACYRNVTPLSAEEKPRRARYVDVRKQLFGRSAMQGKITTALIAISVGVFLLQTSGLAPRFVALLYISEFVRPQFVEIQQGQLWRLVTPIFLHFGILHVLFNMLWLHTLGNQIEMRGGRRQLALLVLAIGAVSNVGQYVIAGPAFGGFSGVVYGLLGYIWIMAQFQPESGYVMDRFTIGFMLVWLLLGMSGMFEGMANAAHLFGLLSGVLWGLAKARNRRNV